MASTSHMAMPGTFQFDGSESDSHQLGVHPGLFRPPSSPSASSSGLLGHSVGPGNPDALSPSANVKRKRQCGRETTPLRDWAAPDDSIPDLDSTADQRLMASRKISGGDRRYVLAGQISTPGAGPPPRFGLGLDGDMEDSTYSDLDYRRALGSKRQPDEPDSPRSFATANSKPDDSDSPRRNGWGTTAFNTIGGVVGKVWQFCTTSAFRGFYAGGGEGFEMKAAPPDSSASERPWLSQLDTDIPTMPEYWSPVPGGFPQSDYAPFSYEHDTPESTPPPAAKRRQIDESVARGDDLRRNWVVVNESAQKRRHSGFTPTHTPSRTSLSAASRRSSMRPISRLDPPRYGAGRRKPHRVSTAGTSSSLSYHEPASYASPRSPMHSPTYHTPTTSRIPVPSRPGSPRLGQQCEPTPSRIPSPGPSSPGRHRRSQSSLGGTPTSRVAGMRRRESSAAQETAGAAASGGGSPRLDREAQRLAARRAQAERKQDARITDFNSRLEEMIRQGKEALGTQVEVDIEDEGDYFGGAAAGAGDDPWEDEP